jgi:hypothetical protein
MDWRIGLLHLATARQSLPADASDPSYDESGKIAKSRNPLDERQAHALSGVSSSTSFSLNTSNTSPVQDVKGKDKSKLL